MYKKIVNYFESNLCVENIYFRKKCILWIFGIIVTLLLELTINCIISNFIANIWLKIGVILLIDFPITLCFFILVYVLPINKIYKAKIKEKTKLDLVGLLMKEERLSAYREIEIEEMEEFIKKKCKINKIESIDTIIDMINEEIKDKYTKKNFREKYFNNDNYIYSINCCNRKFYNKNKRYKYNTSKKKRKFTRVKKSINGYKNRLE